MAYMMQEAHAGAAVPHYFDDEAAAAGMDLREAGIDQRFDALRIEAIGHGHIR
jgi:hypothetical protein